MPGGGPPRLGGNRSRRRSSASSSFLSRASSSKSLAHSSRETFLFPLASAQRRSRSAISISRAYLESSDQSRSSAVIAPSPSRSTASNNSAGPPNSLFVIRPSLFLSRALSRSQVYRV